MQRKERKGSGVGKTVVYFGGIVKEIAEKRCKKKEKERKDRAMPLSSGVHRSDNPSFFIIWFGRVPKMV